MDQTRSGSVIALPRPAVAAARPAPGLGTLLVRLIDTLLDWQERARQRHHLSGLDDHLLRDIGLSRADVEHETAKPFWQP